jgi:sec-independent protein translocase protein TatB
VFNIGPMEFVVLALVGIVILGPDRLPQFTRDAVRMLRSLRELATGAQKQLREELGPEFADIDLRNLNPRTAVQRAVFGEDGPPDFRQYSPTNVVRDAFYGDDSADTADEPEKPVSRPSGGGPVSMSKPSMSKPSMSKPSMSKPSANGASANGRSGTSANGSSANGSRPRPRPRPRAWYDEDAT